MGDRQVRACAVIFVVVRVFLDSVAARVSEHGQGSVGGAGGHVQEDDHHVPEHGEIFCI